MQELTDAQYQAVSSRDARFDGWFVVGVNTTGIYCRPGCPARTPHRENMQAFQTAAAAQGAGFRACRRCRPDAAPGSPEWDVRGDLVARAMRLIGDGVVDREGVEGLASTLGYSPRHLHRMLVAEVGAGPQALARAERAQTARVLIETTDLSFSDIAFAADFASIRQFNDTVRAIFARTPTELRGRAARGAASQVPGEIEVRLAYRAPIRLEELFGFLGRRAIPGVEHFDGTTYRRTLRLPRADGIVALSAAPGGGAVRCRLQLADLRDLTAAVARCRTLLDLDADPLAIDAALADDPHLAPLVAAAPGRRVPGAVDGGELVIRAILGQQVTVAAATGLAASLVARVGERVSLADDAAAEPVGGHSADRDDAPTLLFPTPDDLAALEPEAFRMPATRRRTLQAVARALADGQLRIDPGADRDALEAELLAIPGIGPWTVSYVAMRALRHPDRFLPGDTGVRSGLAALGLSTDPVDAERAAERWRPWRSYAVQHLWAAASVAPATARPASAARPSAPTVMSGATP
ncbi:MAG: AlkA N-terminal domain-containing protein [Solirubrobacteraceae bacterium]|nr:AlkA N-terminal domain-containing protein [Patulibacter sp.]